MYEKSYHTKVIKKDPVREKRARLRRKKKIIFYSFIGLLIAVGIVFVLRIPGLQVRTITVEGTEVVDPVDIQNTILKNLEGNYFFVIPRSNVLLVPLPTLERTLAKTYPRLEKISLARTNATTIVVSVTEYNATYLWCDTDCFFMDQKGMVYSKAPYFSGTTYPKIFIGGREDLPFSPLSTGELALVESLIARLPGVRIAPEEIHFDTKHTARIIFPHHDTFPVLYIDPLVPFEKTMENLTVGIHTEPLASQFLNKEKVLQYIDMRYGDRVIYKFE